MSGMTDGTSTTPGAMMMKMYFHGSIGTDMLFFASWMPTSTGATVGAAFGLFFLAVLERYLHAFRRACDAGWKKGVVGFSQPTSNGPYLTPSSSSTSTFSLTQDQAPAPQYDIGAAPLNSSETTDEKSKDVMMVSQDSAGGNNVNDGNRFMNALHLPKAVRKNADPLREARWSRPFRFGVDVPRGFLQALQTLIHYLLMLSVMTFNIWWLIAVVLGAGIGETLFGRFGSGGTGGSGGALH